MTAGLSFPRETIARSILASWIARGLQVRLDAGQICIRPAGQLSAEELAAARAHRDELVALLRAYEEIAAVPTSWPSPVCASCGSVTTSVYFQMAPGPDRLPWWLCGGCWRSA